VHERRLGTVAVVMMLLLLLVVVRLWLGERGWTAVVMVVVMMSHCWCGGTVE
jgi:hypothetical protein